MTAEMLEMREREIREQERAEMDRKMADYVKNLHASMGWTVAEIIKSMGMSAQDQARVKKYL
ncbi:MAG: hypothetical protein IIZ39_02200 [Blautia sp.]|nr:hypothetical protein [Blautia sp.]